MSERVRPPETGDDCDISRRRLLLAASTSVAAVSAGCNTIESLVDDSGGESTNGPSDGGPSTESQTGGADGGDTETGVAVVLSGAPNGLQKYSCTVSSRGGGVIERIRPDLITGEQFQVVEGGNGSASATVRAADLAQEVGGFEGDRVLFSVMYDQPVSEVVLELGTLTDDEGEEMSPERVRTSDL